DPNALVDFRSPAFDLDNVYGRGPADQPYLYNDGDSFLLGDALHGGSDPQARDLPRNSAAVRRALIGDPRNDENALVSQLQGLFLRFHNRLITEKKLKFAEAQRTLRFHYQWMLIHDFLVKLVNKQTLHSVFPHLASGKSIADDPPVLRFYNAKNEAFMPLEFSVAAYRFGHSMVRPGYRLNDETTPPLPIFGDEGGKPRPKSLRGFMAPLDI